MNWIKKLFSLAGAHMADGFTQRLKEAGATTHQLSEEGQEVTEVVTDFPSNPHTNYIGHAAPEHRFSFREGTLNINTLTMVIRVHEPEDSQEHSRLVSVYGNDKVGGVRWQ